MDVTNPQFIERLIPSPGMIAALLLSCPMMLLAALPFGATLAYLLAAVVPMLLIGVSWFRAPLIVLEDENLIVGKMRIPKSALGSAEFFSGDAARFERGPGLSPGSQRLFRGDIDGVVKIFVTDEADPTDYLLFSSRKGAELVGALATDRG